MRERLWSVSISKANMRIIVAVELEYRKQGNEADPAVCSK